MGDKCCSHVMGTGRQCVLDAGHKGRCKTSHGTVFNTGNCKCKTCDKK
jgi:hypothetical protein